MFVTERVRDRDERVQSLATRETTSTSRDELRSSLHHARSTKPEEEETISGQEGKETTVAPSRTLSHRALIHQVRIPNFFPTYAIRLMSHTLSSPYSAFGTRSEAF